MANLAVREIAVGQFGISSRQFVPIDTVPVALWTIVGVAGGVLTFAYLVPRAARPLRTFGLIAAVVLVISFLPNLWLLLERPFAATTTSAVLMLMLMHLVAAVTCFGFLASVVAWVLYFRSPGPRPGNTSSRKASTRSDKDSIPAA